MVLSWKLYAASQNKDVSLLKVLSCFSNLRSTNEVYGQKIMFLENRRHKFIETVLLFPDLKSKCIANLSFKMGLFRETKI